MKISRADKLSVYSYRAGRKNRSSRHTQLANYLTGMFPGMRGIEGLWVNNGMRGCNAE